MTYSTLDDYINQEFPSKYLKGETLENKKVKVKISAITNGEQVFDPRTSKHNSRIVLHFEGKDQGVILNKTRAGELKELFGPGQIKPESLIGK